MQIHILRHGETDFNKAGIVQGSGVDTDLNETGLAQAQAFYEHYKDADFQLVVTSRLKRTQQTVQGFIDAGVPWITHPDIHEISWGTQEGQPTTAESIRQFRQTTEQWQQGNYDAVVPGGESARELGERLLRFIAWLRTRPAEGILIATHGRTIRALITLLKGRELSEMEGVLHANTCSYILTLQPDNSFVFLQENDTQHLLVPDLR